MRKFLIFTVKKVLDFIGCEYEPKDIKQKLDPRYPKNSGHLTDEKYKEFLSNFNKFRIP